MLKTFTVLVTLPAQAGAVSLEAAIIAGVTASFGTNTDRVRVDAFEGDHTTPARMQSPMVEAHTRAQGQHANLRKPPKPRTWAELSESERAATMRLARDYGGGFVRKLADAWNVADSTNSALIGEAFGAMLIEHYGPDSDYANAT
jgi:hypothetical protein